MRQTDPCPPSLHPLGFCKPENPGGWTDPVNVDTFSCHAAGKYIYGVFSFLWERQWGGCRMGRPQRSLLRQEERQPWARSAGHARGADNRQNVIINVKRHISWQWWPGNRHVSKCWGYCWVNNRQHENSHPIWHTTVWFEFANMELKNLKKSRGRHPF